MIRRSIAVLLLLVTAACTTVKSETRTTAFIQQGFYKGERYEIRQRVLEGPTGTFEQTSVVFRGRSRTCIIDSPNDCELKAQLLIESFDGALF